MHKPQDVFGRDAEWQALEEFATSSSPHALLGVVSGRRRQGKSFLLQALTAAHDGVYVSALELSGREALRSVEQAIGSASGSLPPRLDGWPQAVDALLALSTVRPRPVVLDEFPYLVRAVPELPSVLQAALAPRRAERSASRVRLLLCGSALSFMGGLLSGGAPLRGRASLELVLQPFDAPTAAAFWGVADQPELALRLSAVVGGTPAYRREFVDSDAPASLGGFDRWMVRRVLDPRSPLFREARYLLSDETEVRDVVGYHALLAAVVDGHRTRARLASAVGRHSTEIGHQLTVLGDAGLLRREDDAFRRNRPTYRVAEPLLTCYEAIVRPAWARLERGRGEQVWQAAQPTFTSQVLGPHLEQLARDWTLLHADDLLPAAPTSVSAGVLQDARRSTHQVDVVASAGDRVLALGEVKLGDRLGPGAVDRLREVRALLGPRAAGARLLLFPGRPGNVDPAVRTDPDVEVIEPARLFTDT